MLPQWHTRLAVFAQYWQRTLPGESAQSSLPTALQRLHYEVEVVVVSVRVRPAMAPTAYLETRVDEKQSRLSSVLLRVRRRTALSPRAKPVVSLDQLL